MRQDEQRTHRRWRGGREASDRCCGWEKSGEISAEAFSRLRLRANNRNAATLASMTTTAEMYVPTVESVSPAGRWSIAVRFTDGTDGTVDLSRLKGRKGFEKWSSRRYFRSVHVQGGTAMWGDWEISVCADLLYCEITGMSLDDLYPPLKAAERPSVVVDEPNGKLYVEYPDGTKGHLRPTADMETGRTFPAEEHGAVSDGITKIAPWGEILWKDLVELSAEKVKEFLARKRHARR